MAARRRGRLRDLHPASPTASSRASTPSARRARHHRRRAGTLTAVGARQRRAASSASAPPARLDRRAGAAARPCWAIAAFLVGLRASGPGDGAILSTFETVVTVGLAPLISASRSAPAQLAGAALVVGAVVIACSCGRRVGSAAMTPAARPAAPAAARALAQRACLRATAGPTSPSGTASARSPSSTATRSYLQSRNDRPLTRYFPELASFPAGRYVLDGEIVRATRRTSTRSASASTRPTRGSTRLAGDAGAASSRSTCSPRATRCCSSCRYGERRAALEALALDGRRADADGAHRRRGRALAAREEGVIAKEPDAPYRPGERDGHGEDQARAHDRHGRHGLAPGQGRGHGRRADPRALRAGRAAARGRPLLAASRPRRSASWSRRCAPYETGRARARRARRAGRPGRDLEWVALRPELVVEITFDHTSDGRIRHGAKVQRWRDDKPPAECTVDQLDQ